MSNNASTPPETETAAPAADTTAGAEAKTKTVSPKRPARRSAATSTAPAVTKSASTPATAVSTAKKTATRPAVREKTPPAKETGHEPKPFVAKDTKAKKPEKTKKAKLVRDSFAMPDGEYKQIAALKKRCMDAGVSAKKSQILRAAVANLAKLSDSSLVAAVRRLEATKTVRPGKAKGSK